MAQHQQGPIGRVPLERVFAKHLEFLLELKESGATWQQITTLLNSHGLTRHDGKPLQPTQVRATVSRIKKKNSTSQMKRSISPNEKQRLQPHKHEQPNKPTSRKTQADTALRRKMKQARNARKEPEVCPT